MELWAAGVALLVIAASILILILCGKKIRKGLRIAGICVLGALFAAFLGYIALTFLFLDAVDSHQEEPKTSETTLAEEQNTAVCGGYARGFALVAQYAGINCAWVWGNETDTESHAWNVIYPCDGREPVLVDVTWDDGLSEDVPGQSEVSDLYFYWPLSTEDEHTADVYFESFLKYINDLCP